MRLYDVSRPGRPVHLLFELAHLGWENVGFGEETEMALTVPDLHFGDGLVHEVLAGEVETVGEVVGLLVGQQRLVDVVLDHRR